MVRPDHPSAAGHGWKDRDLFIRFDACRQTFEIADVVVSREDIDEPMNAATRIDEPIQHTRVLGFQRHEDIFDRSPIRMDGGPSAGVATEQCWNPDGDHLRLQWHFDDATPFEPVRTYFPALAGDHVDPVGLHGQRPISRRRIRFGGGM